MSYLKNLAKETVIYGGSSILARVLNYIIITPYLTERLSNQDYGIHGYYYAFAAVLIMLFSFRFETAFFRFGKDQEIRNKVFSTSVLFLLFLSLTFGGTIFIFADPISHFLTTPDHALYIRWFIVITLADTLTAIPFARLRLESRPLRFAALKTLNILLNICFILFFLEIWPNLHIELPVLGDYTEEKRLDFVIFANVIASIVTLCLFIPMYFRIRWVFDRSIWNSMVRYAWPLLIIGLAYSLNRFDSFLIERFLPGTQEENEASLGIYLACMKIAILLNLVAQAYNYAIEPFFFREMDQVDAKVKYARTTKVYAYVTIILGLGIVLHIDILKYLIDDSYWKYLYLVPIMVLANFFLGIYYNLGVWFKVKDKTLIGAGIACVATLVTYVFDIIFLPQWGIIAAPVASLISFIVLAYLTYVIGRKYYPIPYQWNRVALYLFTAILLYLLFTFINTRVELSMIFHVLLSFSLFLGFAYWIFYSEWPRLKTGSQ